MGDPARHAGLGQRLPAEQVSGWLTQYDWPFISFMKNLILILEKIIPDAERCMLACVSNLVLYMYRSLQDLQTSTSKLAV
jgi:hypothetical protein